MKQCWLDFGKVTFYEKYDTLEYRSIPDTNRNQADTDLKRSTRILSHRDKIPYNSRPEPYTSWVHHGEPHQAERVARGDHRGVNDWRVRMQWQNIRNMQNHNGLYAISGHSMSYVSLSDTGLPSTAHGHMLQLYMLHRIMLQGKHEYDSITCTYTNVILMAVGNDIHSDAGLPYGPRETSVCRMLLCRGSHWYNKRAINAS